MVVSLDDAFHLPLPAVGPVVEDACLGRLGEDPDAQRRQRLEQGAQQEIGVPDPGWLGVGGHERAGADAEQPGRERRVGQLALGRCGQAGEPGTRRHPAGHGLNEPQALEHVQVALYGRLARDLACRPGRGVPDGLERRGRRERRRIRGEPCRSATGFRSRSPPSSV